MLKRIFNILIVMGINFTLFKGLSLTAMILSDLGMFALLDMLEEKYNNK